MLTDALPPRSATRVANRPRRPAPRGELTAWLLDHLARPPHEVGGGPPVHGADVLADDDAQLALYCCYELHYRSFAGVDDGWEWEPSLLAFRRRVEAAFERRVAEEVGPLPPVGDMAASLLEAVGGAGGPSLSRHVAEHAGLDEVRELAVHRSAYQLKEADPHTWAIPRLAGGPKAALIEIQLDEYGGGVEAEMHSSLFARTMAALGLDTRYGAYLDLLPGATLATVNLVSLFGLHRRRRGALAGHLAVFEATSVGPMGRYAAALRRLGVAGGADRFYDVHVAADAHHEVVAVQALAAALADEEPALAPDILLGARSLLLVEDRFARHVLACWEAGRSSLLRPVTAGSAG